MPGEGEAARVVPQMPKPHMKRETLLWLIPILIASGAFVVICFNPAVLAGRLSFPVIIIFGLIGPWPYRRTLGNLPKHTL